MRDPNEIKVASMNEIKQNRKLIRRQFYAEDAS